jgi:hypothetical protein
MSHNRLNDNLLSVGAKRSYADADVVRGTDNKSSKKYDKMSYEFYYDATRQSSVSGKK